MNKIVCNYAAVRFLPYRETGEFVNVGVVLYCPQVDYFDFKLEHRKQRRVRHFFPELDIEILKAALAETARRLDARRSMGPLTAFGDHLPADDTKAKLAEFRELIRRRESLVFFGEAGTLLTTNPEQTLDDLFGRLVERQFAKDREYQEKEMCNRLTEFLREWKLKRYYKMLRVGDDEVHVKLPFVHMHEQRIAKAIKPLDLGHAVPMDIYEHGGAWCNRVKRLRDRNLLPEQTLFTVRLPEENLVKQYGAAKEICEELEHLDIKVLPMLATDAIHGWAKIVRPA